MKRWLRKRIYPLPRQEKGAALILAMAFMTVVTLMIVPVLTYSATGIKTVVKFDDKADHLYAADSGVEDVKWKIKYDKLITSISGYDALDYITEWNYELPEVDGKAPINNKYVNVFVKNIWMPKDITTPSATLAHHIIDDGSITIAGGGIRSDNSFHVSVNYIKQTDDNLTVSKIGVWLPPNYSYVNNSSNLGTNPSSSDYLGGKALVWTLSNVLFTSLPGVNQNDSPMSADISFNYTTNNDATPDAVSWIQFSGLSGTGSDITYCWDKDVKYFDIKSVSSTATTALANPLSAGILKYTPLIFADFPSTGSLIIPGEPNPVVYSGKTSDSFTGISASGTGSVTQEHDAGDSIFSVGTYVKTYLGKTEIRKNGGSVNGDYYATGNSLMSDSHSDSGHIRDTWVNSDGQTTNSSSTQVSTSSLDNATIGKAYLYWTGWIRIISWIFAAI